MKKRALKTAIITLEVIAIALAGAAAAFIFLSWRLGQGPVSLDLFKPSVEFAIERRLPKGYDARIGDIDLRRTETRGEYRLAVNDLSIFSLEGREAASAPQVLMTFALGDFLAGRVGPKTIAAEAAHLRIVRRESLNVDIPIVQLKRPKDRGLNLSALLEGRLLRNAFEAAELSNAEVTFYDEVSGRSWTAPAMKVFVRRNEVGLQALLDGEITMGDESAAINVTADYVEDDGVINVAADGDNFPVGDLLSTFYGDRAAIVDAPVSGDANIAFTPEGDVLSSKINAHLGEGLLHIGGVSQRISLIEWAAVFDPNANRFFIERFDFDLEGAKGSVSGEVSISFGDDIRQPESISFDLSSEEIVVSAPEQFPAPVPVQDILLNGQYFVPERRLAVRRMNASFAELAVSGNVTLLRPRGLDGAPSPSPGAIADLDIEGSLDPERLLSIWPKQIATGARDWVEDRLASAHIDNLDFTMNLLPGAVGEDGGFPDDALELTFDARDVTAYYVKEMTPLRGGRGGGVVRGNSFTLNVESARVGDVAISRGEVSFPVFIPKWQPTYYRFTATGRAESILGVLDQKPLLLLSKVNLSPDQFAGDARAVVEVMRPNKRDVPPDEYAYTGTATFENMTLNDLIGGIQIRNAEGEVDLRPRSLTVRADASLAEDAPIEMVWRQNFFKEDGPSDIAISGVFNSSAGDVFGISSRQFLRGPVRFDAKAVGDLGDFQSLDLKADFAEAVVTVGPLGWRKPKGMAATGDLSMVFKEDGVMIDALSVSGDGVEISGALSFNRDGALQDADLSRVYISDSADFAMTASRDANGALDLTAVGPFLNAGPMVTQILEGAGEDEEEGSLNWGPGVSLQARIDEIALRNGVVYRDGALDFNRNAARLQALDFSAFGGDGDPLRVTMALTGASEGPERALEARTSAIGELMRGVFGIDSIEGGEGLMLIALHQPGVPGFAGELEARNLQIVEAPLLARIFSAGSLDGLANLMSGEGIDFDYAYGRFDYEEGVVSVDDMRATGSSVGITADGRVGVGPGGVTQLNGAVAPVYALNSFLGNAPIIGDILVGKEGEGIVAFNYSVSGETSDPSVFVNPLSVLTPGIFRQLMQPSRTTTPEAAPADEAPAPESEPVEEPAQQ
ncbi:MAG: hypothetical protein CMI63_12430 [Parvularcula sp.]|nr:hypothetical protein [Parvularcula sp.]